MPTKQEIRKYIHNIKACNRIEVFCDDDENDYSRWFHFISRNGKFLGFRFNFIAPQDLEDFQLFVNTCIEKELRLEEALSNIDRYAYLVRRAHVKENKRDGVIVRKHGKWTWVK